MKEYPIADELNRRMHYEVVKFSYKKLNNEIRKAIGTKVKQYIIDHDGHIPTKHSKQNDFIMTYWDVDKKEWRSFRKNLLIDVEPNYQLEINFK